jgi:NAD(P)-dependent dehydrogenase (short-subunit alcohol dehydrogenase family)
MGLGAVTAALGQGADVVVAGRRPIEDRPPIEAPPGRLTHVVVDAFSEDSVRALFEEVGELDHLLVTATPPLGSWGDFLEQDVAGAQVYFDGKFFGSWACARYAAPRMRAGGSITFLTGCTRVRPRKGLALVTAAFAAVEAFGEALALDLAPLRVNTIRPGIVASEMWSFMDADERERLFADSAGALPVGRVGTIQDIGDAAVFLMTNGYVTGTVLEVSGGEPLATLSV